MITLATVADLPQILAIYAHARAFMAQHGNPNQWGANRPTEADITAHIAARELYVLREADAITAFSRSFSAKTQPTASSSRAPGFPTRRMARFTRLPATGRFTAC